MRTDENSDPGSLRLTSSVPADVRRVDVEALALPNGTLGEVGAEFRPVNVPANSTDRLEGSETIQHLVVPKSPACHISSHSAK